jgi:hypothetical protein
MNHMSKNPEYAIKVKDAFLTKDKNAEILPNVLRYYIPKEDSGYPLYNLTYRSPSDLQKGKITTHPYGECAKLMLKLPAEVPSDVDIDAYIEMARDLSNDWAIRPKVQFERDVEDISTLIATVQSLVEG